MNKEQAEKLCHKWIEEERGWRSGASSKNIDGEMRARWTGYADTYNKLRRELQEAAGLVVVPDRIAN